MPEITVTLGDTVVQKYLFDKGVFTVGRGKDNDLVLETLSVSRNHARVSREGSRYILSDLHSANGTYVNSVKVSKAQIMDGDIISIGKHKMLFSLTPDVAPGSGLGEDPAALRTMFVDPSVTAELTVTRGKQQGQTFTLDRYETLIGRAADCPVRIHDWFVGKKHAAIYREGSAFSIRDLGKLAGVSVNETVVRGTCRLNDGDEIKIGPVQLRFRLLASGAGIPPPGRKPVEMVVEPSVAELVEQELAQPISVAAAASELGNVEPPASGEVDIAAPEEALSAKHSEQPPTAPASAAVSEAKTAEIAMWEKALLNDSPAIRREAARRLKKLTGKDYEC